MIEAAREVLVLSDKVSAAIRGNATPAEPAAEKPKTVRKPKETPKEPEPQKEEAKEPPVDFDDDIPF